jgi:Flp pilus assembly protein TadG
MTAGRRRGDDGTATVEFVLVALLLLVPLAYVLVAALDVQRAAYAVSQAARTGARAFVTAPSTAVGRERARRAAVLALADQGVPAGGLRVELHCSAQPCLTPAASVRVVVRAVARLPFAPEILGHPVAALPVSAEQELAVEPYSPGRP